MAPALLAASPATTADAGSGIVYTCDPTVDALSAGACNTLNTTIAALYSSAFSNANASIYVTLGSVGLGQSNWTYTSVSYGTYRDHLAAAAADANDNTAITVSVPSVNPYQDTLVGLVTALQRALGMTPSTGLETDGRTFCSLGTAGCYDGVITVSNAEPLYFRIGSILSNQYDFFTVVEHETDEILGTASCAFGNECTGTSTVFPADFFRYHSDGTRSFALGTNDSCSSSDPTNACFSIDGVHMLQQYNNAVITLDAGDWFTNCSNPLVQDAESCAGSAGVDISPTAEILVLDVVGYTLTSSSTSGITIQTNPSGLQFSVDGGAAQTAPQTLCLSQGTHTIAVVTTQAGAAGIQYVFTGWSDSGAASHSITVGSGAATYTASFQTQYRLTISASPAAGGSVSPTSGTFYNAGTVTPITATANAGYAFSGWAGAVARANSASTTVTMSAALTVTANFSSLSPVLTIAKSHAGNFTQGQNGATYSVTVSNTAGAGATNGGLTVTETLPAGLTLVSMAGTGWTCPSGGATCTRSDVLAAGASYPAITVTVNVASTAPSQVTNQVSVAGGGSASAAASNITAITALPHAVSVSPSSGSGASQTFTLVYSDTIGVSDLASAQVIINATNSAASACYVWVTPASGAVWLANDNGTSWSAAMTLGTGGTEQNSQCTLNVAASSGTLSGNTYTLHLAIGFQAAFAGAKNVYGYATTQAGLNSGWQSLGTWTVPAPPQAVSVSPSTGSGASQTFTFVYADSNGAADLASAQALIGASITGVSSCYVWVTPGTGAIWLASDAGTWASPLTLGTAGTLQNSQCAVNVGSSSGTPSGNTYTLDLAVSFQTGFSGAKSIYSYASSMAALNSGWQTVGTWTAGTVSAIHAVSVTPAAGSGASQLFSFQFSDSSGASDLATVSALINTSTALSSACSVTYNRANNTLALLTDAGAQPSGTIAPGSSSQQNSQCTLTGSASSVTTSGNTLTLNLAIGFQSGFAGAKNVYGSAQSAGGASTGLQQLGSWTVAVTSHAPQAVSVSPASGSGASQTFTFVYTDVNGATDLGSAQAIINASNTGVSSCYVWVTPGTGAIWLASDTETWPAGMTLGTAGTLQNSQCAVNVGSSSGTLLGNTYTLSLAISFQSGFSGAKSIYSYATSLAGLNSGWQTLGMWTAGTGAAIHAVSVSPSSGSGVSQTFTFVYTDSNGASDLASAQALIGTSITGISSCYVWVTPGSGAVWLANDSGTWPAGMTLGTAGTVQNSQCAVNVGASSGALSGNTYTLTLAISFESGFAGAKTISGLATNPAGLSSGWQTLGSWTAAGGGAPALHAVSVSPSSGGGLSQTFTFVYTDSNGAADFASAQALISTSITSISSCYVWVTPASGAVWLANDNGTWPAAMTLGAAGTLQNSQCAVSVGSSSGALSGNTYTLNLAITFQSGFTGAKNVYGLATSTGAVSSGWATVGAWTP
jgi:uncharacterized repeat protein (TIGR01451 family)